MSREENLVVLEAIPVNNRTVLAVFVYILHFSMIFILQSLYMQQHTLIVDFFFK